MLMRIHTLHIVIVLKYVKYSRRQTPAVRNRNKKTHMNTYIQHIYTPDLPHMYPIYTTYNPRDNKNFGGIEMIGQLRTYTINYQLITLNFWSADADRQRCHLNRTW